MKIAYERERGGQLVREAWVRWASRLPDPKPSWLVPWEDLPEQDKEADRCIWDEIVAPYVQVMAELNRRLDQLDRDYVRLLQEKLYRDLNSQ